MQPKAGDRPPGGFHLEIAHEVLLHLPINIVWRLLGLNRVMNKVLLLEYFWKQRCEREFGLLHDKISSYRRYYLIHSQFIRGNLYENNGNIIQSRIDWCPYYDLYMKDGQVFHKNIKICSGVAYVGEMYKKTYHRDRSFLLGMTDGTKMSLMPGFYIYEVEQLNQQMICFADISRTGQYIDDKVSFVLLDNGELLYRKSFKDTWQVYARDVVQIAAFIGNILFINFRDGHVDRLRIGGDGMLVAETIGRDRYIKFRVISNNIYMFTEDGRCDVCSSSEDRIVKTFTLDAPIRSALHLDKQEILLTIDGRGYLNQSMILIKRLVEIDVFGLINVIHRDGQYYVFSVTQRN